jgi:hypothetical protein
MTSPIVQNQNILWFIYILCVLVLWPHPKKSSETSSEKKERKKEEKEEKEDDADVFDKEDMGDVLQSHAKHVKLNGAKQGLTLVCFSAQPKPFWSHLPVSPCLIDWGKVMHPTYPKQCAYVEPKSGRVFAPGAKQFRSTQERGFDPAKAIQVRGLHPFPFPLNLSLLYPFPLNLS